MNRRSFFSFLAAGVAVLLLIGVSGYFWIVSRSPLTLLQGGRQATPAAAMFVSRQAPVMVSMLVNPDQLESLQQLSTRPGERRRSRQEIDQLKTNLLSNTGLDYRRDIQPWLGEEITLAVTTQDIDRDEKNGRQPGYLMILGVKDSQKSREFLELLFSKRAIAGKKLASEQYQGVNLLYDNDQFALPPSPSSLKSHPSLAGALVGDRFVLFANHPKVLREAINNVQATDLSLNSSNQYQQALALLPSQQIGVAFLNLQSVAAWLGKKLDPQIYTSQIVTLQLNRQGLLAETKFIAAPDREIAPPSSMSQAVKALQHLPEGSSLAISGIDLSNLKNSNLNQLWTQATAVLSGSGNDVISRLVTQPLEQLQARWGIDLLQDVFSWVQGEYVLGMLPHADSSTPDWIFVVEKSDAAAQGIAHLDAIAQTQGLDITPLSVGEQKIYAWTQLTTAPTVDIDRSSLTLKAKVQGVHATTEDYEILTTSVEAMDAALKAPQVGTLVGSADFQTGIKIIPQPNQGYIYLNWQGSQEILEQQLPILKLLEIAGKPFFNNLRSLTASSYRGETEVLQGSLFFRLIP